MLSVVAEQQNANYAVSLHYDLAVIELVYLEQTMYCKCKGGISHVLVISLTKS